MYRKIVRRYVENDIYGDMYKMKFNLFNCKALCCILVTLGQPHMKPLISNLIGLQFSSYNSLFQLANTFNNPLSFSPHLHPCLAIPSIYKGSCAALLTAKHPGPRPRATNTNYLSCQQALVSFFLLFKPNPLVKPLFVALRGDGL